MRKSTALKTIFRSPVKTMLTFLLIAAASFALFSRVTDYAVTTRESAKAESFYYGVAALDNSTPPMGYYDLSPKPWPSEEQIGKFTSLPGVTLADTRYTTDGFIEGCKRVIDPEGSLEEGEFLLEGTYDGYEDYSSGNRYITFRDVKVYAGDLQFDPEKPLQIATGTAEFCRHDYPRTFFEGLKKGSRCFVVGTYSERSGTSFELGSFLYQYMNPDVEFLTVIDGLGEDYLDTEDFAWYKKMIEARNQSLSAYDIVYTKDMRAVPYVNERRMVVTEGRPLTARDSGACVVSEDFLKASGMSVGDKIHIGLGDKLLMGQGASGARVRLPEEISQVKSYADLEIIGTYRFTNEWDERRRETDWSYGPATIFVPSSLLPVEVPEDHEILMGDFSVFIEDPHDIQEFRQAAEPLAADLSLGLRFSDGGWSAMKDNFQTGSLASLLTTALYVLGAALALLLAVYLYIGRNKKSYAIMRTLGVPGGKAGRTLALPFGILSAVAMLAGGLTGLYYASYTAAKTLAGMSDNNAPEGYSYVLSGELPMGVVILCLACELLFILSATLLFLRNMKKTPPLELLQEGARGTDAAKKAGILQVNFGAAKHMPEIVDTAPVPRGLDIARLSVLELGGDLHAKSAHGRYSALRQVGGYVLRHMRRGLGKTAVSLLLAVVLAAGLGMFVLAKVSYQEAYRDLEVKGRAMMFNSTKVMELAKSDLVKDVYFYNKFSVRVNGVGVLSPISFTNDFDRYLIDDFTVSYADGYGASVFEGTGPVCLVGKTLAKELNIHAGDEIKLMSEDLYSFMPQVYEEDELEFAIDRAGKPFKVAGILESEDADTNAGIFAAINEAAENLYSQPFPVNYCEFTLTDNNKVTELNSLLEEKKSTGIQYSPQATYHVDADLFENTKRMCNLLESLFPIAVAAAALIGLFGPGLVILQSVQEAAFLRILGVTKKRARCMLVLEQMLLCVAGMLLVAGGLLAFSPGLFMRSLEALAFCWLLYFLGCACGAFAASVQVTRLKVMELLQVKE